jgi:NitT/TauT family transport system ATP-binding protein
MAVAPDAPHAAAAISARNAGKLFLDGAVVAFRQMTIEVRRQEILCIVGPSGCGKTTFLRAIAGLTDLNAGELLVFGRPVAGPPQGVAMVFQHFGLLPWKTVYQNAAFGLAMAGAGRARIAERVRHYLDLVGLTGFESQYPYQLSGGMQQRVGLVRALVVNPSILLMDEPFAALDAQTREILQDELLELMGRPDERKTMVFITHSIDEAILLGDRVAVMTARPGRIKEVMELPFGRPRDVEAVRADPRFAELRAHIWRLLRTEDGERRSDSTWPREPPASGDPPRVLRHPSPASP